MPKVLVALTVSLLAIPASQNAIAAPLQPSHSLNVIAAPESPEALGPKIPGEAKEPEPADDPAAQQAPTSPAPAKQRHRHHWVGYVIIVGIVIGMTFALAAGVK